MDEVSEKLNGVHQFCYRGIFLQIFIIKKENVLEDLNPRLIAIQRGNIP